MRRSGVIAIFAFVALLGFASRASAAAMAITSATSTVFTVGTAKTFNGTTNAGGGTLTESGALPTGVTFTDAIGGNFTISGTAATGTEGTYPITIIAAGGTNTGSATFTVTVGPLITSASTTTFTVGSAGTFTVTTVGSGTTLTKTGTLPAAVTFTDNGDGTATLAGTPAAGTAGTYPISIKAANANGGSNTQPFALIVAAAPTGATCQTLDANQRPRTRFLRNDRFFVKGVLPGSNGTVNVLFNNDSTIGSGRQNEDGSYLVSALVPSDATFGGNTVTARKLTVSATCGINVVPLTGAAAAATATPRPATTLPRTGSPILPMGVAGLLFLGTGTGMLLYYRRQAFAVLSAVWTEADVFFVREENRLKGLFTGLVRKIRR